jgi:hypothetical protein
MMDQPSEVWDWEYPDEAEPNHPAHPEYDTYHPAPVIEVVVAAIIELPTAEGLEAA